MRGACASSSAQTVSTKGSTFGAIAVSSRAQSVGVDLRLAEPAAQRIVMGEDALDLRLQARQILQVHDADGAPPDLVLIGRTDAALGGADLPVARVRPRAASRARGGAAGSASRSRRCEDCRG